MGMLCYIPHYTSENILFEGKARNRHHPVKKRESAYKKKQDDQDDLEQITLEHNVLYQP